MSLSCDNRQLTPSTGEHASSLKPSLEMKSIKPYQSKGEYIYAMKHDLAKWFNTIYSFPASSSIGDFSELNALNILDELEDGVLICLHANTIMKAALNKAHKFRKLDLKNAGIINASRFRFHSSEKVTHEPLTREQNSADNLKKLLLISAVKRSKCGDFFGEYLLFKAPTIPKSFHARDNVISFIKWCRHVANVRECLMFEADDLMLRKNENNFILCLIEVARFGSTFGIEIPASFQTTQEQLFKFDNANCVSLFNINNMGTLSVETGFSAREKLAIREQTNKAVATEFQDEILMKSDKVVTLLPVSVGAPVKSKVSIKSEKCSNQTQREESETATVNSGDTFEVSLEVKSRKKSEVGDSREAKQKTTRIKNEIRREFSLIDLAKFENKDENKLKVDLI